MSLCFVFGLGHLSEFLNSQMTFCILLLDAARTAQVEPIEATYMWGFFVCFFSSDFKVRLLRIKSEFCTCEKKRMSELKKNVTCRILTFFQNSDFNLRSLTLMSECQNSKKYSHVQNSDSFQNSEKKVRILRLKSEFWGEKKSELCTCENSLEF